MALAFAVSIALHEVVAGLVPRNLAQAPQPREIVTRTRILHVTLRRTPVPLRPAPLHAVIAVRVRPRAIVTPRPVEPPAVRAIARKAQGNAGARPAFHRITAAHGPAPAQLIAASTTGAGVAAAGVGAGSGPAARGNGGDANNADGPCGFVTFSDPHGSQYDPGTRGFWVDIRMSVHFADGTMQSMILDYPWYYASEAANPWSDQNLKDPSFPTRFQTPPPSKSGGEPPLVQYVMAHSAPNGMTLLRDCPQPSSPPAN